MVGKVINALTQMPKSENSSRSITFSQMPWGHGGLLNGKSFNLSQTINIHMSEVL